MLSISRELTSDKVVEIYRVRLLIRIHIMTELDLIDHLLDLLLSRIKPEPSHHIRNLTDRYSQLNNARRILLKAMIPQLRVVKELPHLLEEVAVPTAIDEPIEGRQVSAAQNRLCNN